MQGSVATTFEKGLRPAAASTTDAYLALLGRPFHKTSTIYRRGHRIMMQIDVFGNLDPRVLCRMCRFSIVGKCQDSSSGILRQFVPYRDDPSHDILQ